MKNGSGFCGVGSVSGGDSSRVLAGVQSTLFDAVDEICLWVDRVREADGPLSAAEGFSEIESAVSVCDGQLSILDGVSL